MTNENKIKDGGPVHPSQYPIYKLNHDGNYVTDYNGIPEVARYASSPGISIRDWFAGMAMQGMIASNANPNSFGYSLNENAKLPVFAYVYADAMLVERDNKREAILDEEE